MLWGWIWLRWWWWSRRGERVRKAVGLGRGGRGVSPTSCPQAPSTTNIIIIIIINNQNHHHNHPCRTWTASPSHSIASGSGTLTAPHYLQDSRAIMNLHFSCGDGNGFKPSGKKTYILRQRIWPTRPTLAQLPFIRSAHIISSVIGGYWLGPPNLLNDSGNEYFTCWTHHRICFLRSWFFSEKSFAAPTLEFCLSVTSLARRLDDKNKMKIMRSRRRGLTRMMMMMMMVMMKRGLGFTAVCLIGGWQGSPLPFIGIQHFHHHRHRHCHHQHPVLPWTWNLSQVAQVTLV